MAFKNLFDYGGKRRKIGHSKLKQTVNSLGSANFGSLDLACEPFETIPDDYIWANQNTLTKVKPMVSPAFTRIHQNWYAFYVRNQQVWKHWNDYITNGTAYSQVYGSNLTNQQNSNLWEPPSIPANHLQMIAKLATGHAMPIYRAIITREAFMLYFGLTASDFSFTNLPTQSFTDSQVFNELRVTDFVSLVFSKYPAFQAIPYFEAYVTSGHFLFEFGGSHAQLQPMFDMFGLERVDVGQDQIGNLGYDVTQDPANLHYENYHPVMFRMFADDASSDVSLDNSPFVLSRSVVHSTFNNLDLNTFLFTKRLDLDNFLTDNNGELVSANLRKYTLVRSRYFGSSYVVQYTGSSNSPVFHGSGFTGSSDTSFYWTLSGSWLGLSDGLKTPDEIYNFLQTVTPYLGVTTSSFFDMLSGYQGLSTSSLHSWSSDYNYPVKWTSCFDFYSIRQHKNTTSVESFRTIGANLSCDVVLNVVGRGDIYYSNHLYDPLSANGVQSRSTDSLGYFSIDWMIYLCKQAIRHMDNNRLPIDSLSVRRFVDYRMERFNALPFFGYSNIWNNYFRNSALSSPEFDYSETNGSALQSREYISALVVGPQINRQPSWISKYASLSDIPTNSWVIPFQAIPKNGLSQENLSVGNMKIFVNGQSHYYTIYDYNDLFALLTGYGLDLNVLQQQYTVYTQTLKNVSSGSMLDYLTFSDLYTTNFYLPNYYNGLLHLKYQNFNKDYFSSAMLDPMSGANQVELGDTINELRVNEAKQSWFETIAKQRSVKGFFNAIFGVTPIECDDKARLMGTDHVDINIGEVIQTSQTDITPQGSRSGLGQAKGSGGLMKGHCNEHGFVFILRSHTIEAQYFQGLSKMWIPKDSYMDYPTIDFQHIGNESILQKEVNYNTIPTVPFTNFTQRLLDPKFDGGQQLYDQANINRFGSGVQKYNGVGNPVLIKQTANTNTRFRNVSQTAGTSLDNIFGYAPRYSTYKFKFDELHGEMRTLLKAWQTFRKFFTQPILSHEFVNWELLADSEDLNKIFAVTSDDVEDKFIIDSFINFVVDRPLAYVCAPYSK